VSGPHAVDKRAVRRSFGRAAATYDAAAALQREVCDRMLERLDYVKLAPAMVLDAGSGTGYAEAKLRERYPRAVQVAVDLSEEMLATARARTPWWKRRLPFRGVAPAAYVSGDIEALPLATGAAGLAFSNLALQWAQDLPGAFAELLRVLAPGGLVMFSTFGPDTLKELRAAYAAVDGYTHVNRFVDMHDIGDMLVHAGFADPVIDMEQITMTYADAMTLMRDLKAIGAHNVTEGRPRALAGRRALQAVATHYEQHRRDGRLPATYEVVYGHAWKPLQPRRLADGRQVVQLHFPSR
jgi:malonyl-CoA O-methyltransferase